MDYPEHIAGFRSRPINGIIDAGRAARPVAGAGATVRETAGGSVVSLDPRAAASLPRPFDVRLISAFDASGGSRPFRAAQVFVGRVFEGSPPAELSFVPPDETEADTDEATGLQYVTLPLDGAGDVWAHVSDGQDGRTFSISSEPDQDAVFSVLLASVSADGAVSRRVSGDIFLPGHWGAAKPLTELPADADGSWEARKNPTEGETASAVAESSLIELELDEEGRVSAKRYRTRTFDTHGNLIAISDRTESATPDPGGEEEPDPCGNPLNEGSEATDDDWDNPLEGGGEAGDEKDEESPREWDNPLDHEGDGGFTPPCRKN